MRATLLTVMLTFGALSVFAHSQRRQKSERREQSAFSAEEKGVGNPVTVPEDVLRILRADKRNQACLTENQTPEDMHTSWFTASQIRLNDDALPSLIVLPVNPCLFGANINPFWVFRNTPRGYRLALSISTHDLEVLKTKSKGYRNIRATAATAREYFTTVYSFDGSGYRAGPTRRHAIR